MIVAAFVKRPLQLYDHPIAKRFLSRRLSHAAFNRRAVHGDSAEQELRVELAVAASAGASGEALAAVDFCLAGGALVGVAPPGGATIFGREGFLAIRRASEFFRQRPERRRVVGMHQVRHFMPERDQGLVPAVI